MRKSILVVFVFLFSFNVFARNLIIAGIPQKPNRWEENGKFKGIDVDIMDYILKKMDISYEIVLCPTSARLIESYQQQDSKYDMIFTYSKKKSREKYLDYASESHMTIAWNLFYAKENQGKYHFENYSDLTGLKIGATKGYSYTDEFWKAGKDNIFEIDIVVKNDLQLRKLIAGRFDLVPLNTQGALYEAKVNGISDKIAYLPKPIKSKPYYNTFVKSSSYPYIDEIKKRYDEILAEMKKDGTLESIYNSYLK